MDIMTLYRAYKKIKMDERKQIQYDKLSAEPLNYGIIRDLINTAMNGITITITLKDSTKMEIKREDAFDKLQNKSYEAF